MKIAVRVDASQAIGTGHVRRTLALARALRRAGGTVHFVTRALGIDSAAMIAAADFAVAVLPPADGAPVPPGGNPHAEWARVDAATDVAQTLAAIADFPADWIVTDHYAFGAEWHRPIHAETRARMAAIDDLADRDHAVALLIDHNDAADHRAKYAGRLPDGVRLLGGPRFALLGPEFAEAPRYRFAEAVGSIGIFMGGVDADGLSQRVLAAIDRAGFAGPVEIVTTRANPHLDALRAAVASRPGTTLSIDLPNLAGFFARHDLQIGAGGGASWERCCIGVPTLLLVVAENQRAVVPRLVEQGIVATAESLKRDDLAIVIRMLILDSSRRQRMANRARVLVDGRGAARVAEAMVCA